MTFYLQKLVEEIEPVARGETERQKSRPSGAISGY